MQQIKVYISAKLEHAAKLAALREDGFHINARWIDTHQVGRDRLKPVTHWQQENFDDIAAAHFFILYVEPGDHLKGSLFEIGYAIGIGKKCWIAGDGHGLDVRVEGEAVRLPHRDVVPWCHYRQRIRMTMSLADAFRQMRELVRPLTVTNMDGSAPAAQQF